MTDSVEGFSLMLSSSDPSAAATEGWQARGAQEQEEGQSHSGASSGDTNREVRGVTKRY